jgi:MarR family transcriptional regulator, 2-MHQ and catechol-resistance regulon repressor
MSPTSVSRRSAGQERALKLFVVLERAAGSVVRCLQTKSDLQGLTHTEFEILEALYHKGPLLLGDVQKKILLSSGGVTYTVDRLAEKGFVERRECESDRRARYAALTPKGRDLMDRILPPIVKQIEETMSVLSVREQEEVINTLRKLGLNAAAAAD